MCQDSWDRLEAQPEWIGGAICGGYGEAAHDWPRAEADATVAG